MNKITDEQQILFNEAKVTHSNFERLEFENKELREECKFLRKMITDERRFILETFKHDVIENYRTMTYANREHEKELHRATQNINLCDK
ncbi:hypothetical protein [Streptococcus parauberis]|uniref:hypothetical protein n=1 Tax=Streptococcus parauberis TaxID=1348 RepID=UPI00059F2726|nr:hypothetical protein [Streptococcus parauberis]UWM90222.1 hypothetical protein N2A94_06900 [Streptococcus parauberis]